MRVIIVEDDPLTVEELLDVMQESDLVREVETFETERAFIEAFASGVLRTDDLFVIDVMLRWDDPRPDPLEPPAAVKSESYFRAGLRCVELLLSSDSMRTARIILVSNLDAADVEHDLRFRGLDFAGDVIPKGGSWDPLLRGIRSASEGRGRYRR
jgi:DNA-binding NarL/FixJ family response regulator